MKHFKVTKLADVLSALQDVWDYQDNGKLSRTVFHLSTTGYDTNVWTRNEPGEDLLLGALTEGGTVFKVEDR